MEKWDVVVVIIALVGMGATVLGPVVKLTRAITRLTVAMENMEHNVAELTTNNENHHEALWANARRQDVTLSDHESRIRVMESDRNNERE